MTGFSYKNLLLQIIQGNVIILTFICLQTAPLKLDNCFGSYNSTTVLLLPFLAFLIGVFIDFIADIIESAIVKYLITPPIFYLLTKDNLWGITLAHKEYILNELCRTAAEYKKINKNKKIVERYYQSKFRKPYKEIINYILQVAKNKAYGVCKDYQKEQIDSFFILYIFSRNISLSLLLSSFAFFIWSSNIIVPIVLLSLVLFAFASSYRYYLYYLRVLLGTTIQKEHPC